jgi:hypothetical protein
LGERQIAEFVENDEVHSRELIGDPTLPSVTGLDLEPVDEIDHVVEPATGAGADAASGVGNGQMGLAGAGPADQHGVALLSDEATLHGWIENGIGRLQMWAIFAGLMMGAGPDDVEISARHQVRTGRTLQDPGGAANLGTL